MNVFAEVVSALLRGAFVCEVTAPAGFRFLRNEESRAEVDAYLRRLGRSLATTPGNLAYYAAILLVQGDDRDRIRSVFKEIKHQVRPVLQMITLCMDAINADSAPSVGERVEFGALLNAIASKDHLASRLQQFQLFGQSFAPSDASPKAMLEKVITNLEKWDYLRRASKESDGYVFTGKLDYFYEVSDFLVDHEDIKDIEEAAPEPETGALF